jgi:enoyl-CoA hydratase/carnithine racemase
MQCDIRYVAKAAKLAIPQVRRGVMGDGGSHWTVARAASRAVAADLLLTGRTFQGEEMVRLGLASEALDGGAAVLAKAMDVARDMAIHCAPLSMAVSKRLLWADAGLDEVCDLETAYHRVLMGSADSREGPRAWFERRAPQWSLKVSEEWGRVLDEEGRRGG